LPISAKIWGSQPPAERAFSLVEMLMVVALIAILAGSVTVSVRGAADRHALRTAAEDLAGVLRYGFAESHLRSCAHRLRIAAGGHRYHLEAATADPDRPFGPAAGIAGRARRLPTGVQITAVENATGPGDALAAADPPEDGPWTLLCVRDGGFVGTIRLRGRGGGTVAVEVLAASGQVHVHE